MVSYREYKLGLLSFIEMGQSPPSNTYNVNQEGLPFFQGKSEFTDKHPVAVKWCSKPQKIAEEGDVLLSVRAPVGPTNIAREKCCIGRGLSAIRAHNKVLRQDYLSYFFKHIEPTFSLSGQGAIFKAISRREIENLSILLPALSEQRRIVEILDQADEIRKLRKQADEKAEKIIAALFFEMFGDVKKKSGLEKSPLSEIIDLKYGTGLPSRKRVTGEFPVYGSNGIVDYHNESLIDFQTIIIGRKGSAGMLHLTSQPCWPIDTTFYVELKKKQVNLVYLFLALKELRLDRLAIITGVPGINRETILSQWIFLPDNDFQNKIESYYYQLEKIRAESTSSNDKIDNLFNVLLSSAFDGSLTSSWREAHMKELLQEMEEQKKYLEKVN